MFQFVLLSNTPYTPLPRELVDGADMDTDQDSFTLASVERSDVSFDVATRRRTIVAVEVTDAQHGATHYWSLAKLRS